MNELKHMYFCTLFSYVIIQFVKELDDGSCENVHTKKYVKLDKSSGIQFTTVAHPVFVSLSFILITLYLNVLLFSRTSKRFSCLQSQYWHRFHKNRLLYLHKFYFFFGMKRTVSHYSPPHFNVYTDQ